MVSVGGTSLSTASNSRGWTESVWNTNPGEGTGSGCSAFEPQPSWQTALGAVPKVPLEDNTQAWIGDHCMASDEVPGVLLSNRKINVAAPVLAAGNLVTNPGFEKGDFTGWTLAGNAPHNTVVEMAGFDSWNPHSGTFFAALGAAGSDNFQ